MPYGDRTGPWGHGPRTGRAAGYCAGYSVPGYMNPHHGFGRGFGRGWGRGFGRGFRGRGRGFWWKGYYGPTPYGRYEFPAPSREDEKAYLENSIKDLEEELKAIHKRLQELSNEEKETP